MRKQKWVTFTRTARELKKGTGRTKQVGVEVELLKDSPSDIVADTQETPEPVASDTWASVEKIIQSYQSTR